MDDRRTGGCWVTLGGRYRLLQSLKESHSLTYHSSSTASIPHPTHAYAESVTVRERGATQRVVCLFLVCGVLLEGRIPFHFITRAPCLKRAACLFLDLRAFDFGDAILHVIFSPCFWYHCWRFGGLGVHC
jgi:hypothetical protein